MKDKELEKTVNRSKLIMAEATSAIKRGKEAIAHLDALYKDSGYTSTSLLALLRSRLTAAQLEAVDREHATASDTASSDDMTSKRRHVGMGKRFI